MKSRVVALVLVVALVSGCGPRTIPVVSSTDVDRANQEIVDRRVTMTMEDGTRMSCERAVVGLDTCTCVYGRGREVRRIPASSVKSVKIGRPGRGALWGFLIGAGSGLVMGGIDYLAAPDKDWAGAGLVVFPILNGLIGLIVGPFTTYDLYEIGMDGPEPVRSELSESAGGGPDSWLMGSSAATPPN